ncbi:uncharacterized protein Triagg1_5889 [Trichoderma aggressivum f. europaeum]|uniref:Uncharacterized protein n=1 Tax=Trichoderma aggressivum f. europaeum TaxID=173218 RepID=A0AAE1LZW5_9HYPO|nr:hypothetical protein Triagg1_5889 [Trichoderma aggressivum f. europaeum]
MIEPILETLLASLAVRPARTADPVLRHALLLATRHLAKVTSDLIAADVSNGTAPVGDARIALLAVSPAAVGAAHSHGGHAAVVADYLAGTALGGGDDGGGVLEVGGRRELGEEACGRLTREEVCGGESWG